MSRKNNDAGGRVDVHNVDQVVQLVCARDRKHGNLGKVVRRSPVRDMLEDGLERLDGPDGETVIRTVCRACRAQGNGADLQIRWDRIVKLLDEMVASGDFKRKLPV